MKQYICGDCGEIIDEDELITVDLDRGEYWGVPCYETVDGCPYCKSDDIRPYEEDEEDEEDET